MNLSKLGKIQLNFYESTNVFAFYESNSTHLLYGARSARFYKLDFIVGNCMHS